MRVGDRRMGVGDRRMGAKNRGMRMRRGSVWRKRMGKGRALAAL